MKSFATMSVIGLWVFTLVVNCLSPDVKAQTSSCIIIEQVHGMVPPGQANLAQLRVIGKVSANRIFSCGDTVFVTTNITSSSKPAAVDPSTGRFVVTFKQFTPQQVNCNISSITIKAWCKTDTSCKVEGGYPLKCCELPSVSFQGRVLPPGTSLTPTHIWVSGQLLGCFGDKVVVNARILATNTLIGPSPPTLINDSLSGGFNVSLPVPTGVTVNCDDSIWVKAWCASDTNCYIEREDILYCADCFRAKVRPITAPCIGTPSKQPIQLEAIISIPAGNIMYFLWNYGDGIAGAPHWTPLPPFKADNSSGTANTTFLYTTPSNNYAPGSYTARLVNVDSTGVPIGECADILLPLTVQCPSACPTAIVSKTGESATCVNGKRKVTLEATVTAPATSPAVGQWNPGPSGSSTGPIPIIYVPSGQTQVKTATFDYPPGGPYTACIMWDQQAHPTCKDSCDTFSVALCPCDTVKLAHSPDPVPCISTGGTQQVNFVATFDPTYTGWFQWEVKGGGQPYIETRCAPSYPNPPSSWKVVTNPEEFSYNFKSSGIYNVKVTVLTSSPPCDNPSSSDDANIQIDDCCPKFSSNLSAFEGVNPCDWFFAAQVKNPNNAQLSFEWDFGDGNTKTTTTAGVSHTYNTSGQMRVRVVVNAQGCTDTLITFIDVACQPDTPPTVTGCSVSAGTPGTITVTFSEDVDQAAAQDRANYAITVNGQTVPPTSITSISYDPASSTATINGVTINPGETVTVTVTGVPDKAGNVIVGNNVATCSPSDEPPTVVPNCSVTAGQPGMITVTFSEDVDQTAAQDPANYEIRVNGQKVAPSSISYSPNTATINGVSINPLGVVTVKVTGVRDKAGNVIVANGVTNVSICMATPPVVKPPNGRPQWPDWLCGILLVLALLALAVALIAAFIWGCTLASGNPVSLVTMLVTGGALLIFLICIVLWGFFCASAHCGILCALITTVMWLIGITFIALIILAILLNPCFLGTIFDGALLGLALAILIRIAQAVGCAIPVWPSFLCP